MNNGASVPAAERTKYLVANPILRQTLPNHTLYYKYIICHLFEYADLEY